ncbi:MAG TPA: HAMP domain-containing sensor histidine kinase, partial [Longimicrobium sp.]
RTPLNAIGGYADLLALGVHGPLTEEQMRDVQRITASQQHLLAIINDILDYSRIEGGRLAYERAAVPLEPAIGEVASMVQALAGSRGVDLRVAARPLVACADRLKVEQVLLNLLSNALKFTPQGGRVEVECGERDGHAVITVADTGIGIPPEQVEQIFEPFVQVGRSLTSGHEGTGLGLSISRTLARGMGGELTAESTPGEGSVFTLTLPLAEEADAGGGDANPPPRQ